MNRREFLNTLSMAGLISPILFQSAFANTNMPLLKQIPRSKEFIPSIGMGTWISFNVGASKRLRDARAEVLKTFFDMGGRMVDSSPMYGSAEEVMGYCLKKLGYPKSLFSTTKVWTASKSDGEQQILDSENLWGIKPIDLFLVHNLLSWKEHLETLLEKKRNGEIRYIGVSTSHGSRHEELEKIMLTQEIDFIQCEYNVLNRKIENRILPLAQEKGIAVIINRPFKGGALFNDFDKLPLPSWKSEYDINNWAQFFLKFVISHPAVTCSIPATSKIEHIKENMGAMYGKVPDAQARAKMIQYIESL